MSNATLTIGDRNRAGDLEITDTAWDHNGTMRVTVRELTGQCEIDVAAARRLARRAIHHPEKTRSSRVIRTWFAQGSTHVTFAVSRLDPR